VIVAYARACAICRLKHPELLDAAHIVPDSKATGSADVTNGLALCKLHHAAFDRDLVGITADYVVRVNRELMREVDGPMLKHGIQDMDGTSLYLPKQRNQQPSKEGLSTRFEQFLGG